MSYDRRLMVHKGSIIDFHSSMQDNEACFSAQGSKPCNSHPSFSSRSFS